jgi:hypothetical protein
MTCKYYLRYWAPLAFVVCLTVLTSTTVRAQSDVEIEVAGPWSYAPDPSDSSRLIVIAPNLGHIMSIFTGDDAFNYPSKTLPLGPHRLDFPTVSCGSATASSYFLYPANNVDPQLILAAAKSSSLYSVSIPKPCSYETNIESVFKYNGVRPTTTTDPERSFTTWMILHYKVDSTTTGAALDEPSGTPPNTPFGNNVAGSTKKAISIIVYQNTAPHTACDPESAAAFDANLDIWKQPHVYRAFPELVDMPVQNSNQQEPGVYNNSCAQTYGSSGMATMDVRTKPKSNTAKTPDGILQKRAPGRADCHAAQVNVNGVVN